MARAAAHAEQAGVADRTDWWQVDARTFEAEARSYDLVTTHFLHFAANLAQDPSLPQLEFLQVELDESQTPTFGFVPGVATTSLASCSTSSTTRPFSPTRGVMLSTMPVFR